MGTQKPSGGGGKGGEIRAGGGFWELNLRDNLTKALDKIQAKVRSFGSMLSKVGGGMMGGGAALGAGPLGLLFGGGSRLAETAQLARQFQVPIKLMGAFQHAAERAGVSVGEVMDDTRGRFKDLLGSAPLVNPKEAEAALKIQNDFKDSIRSLQDALTPILQILAPIVSKVAEFVKVNSGGVRVLGAVAIAITGIGVAAKLTGLSVVGMFAAITSPVGIAVIAIAGLTALFVTNTEAGKEMASTIGESFRGLGEIFGETWGGLVEAVKAGDLEGAFEVMANGVRAIWFELLVQLGKGWNAFVSSIAKIIKDNPALAPALGGGIGLVTAGPVGALIGIAGGAGVSALDLESMLSVDTTAAVGRARLGRDRLKKAISAIKQGAPGMGDEEAKRFADYGMMGGRLNAGFAAVKGGFNASSSLGQFGYGDKVSVETEIQKAIRENTKKTAVELANLVVALQLR